MNFEVIPNKLNVIKNHALTNVQKLQSKSLPEIQLRKCTFKIFTLKSRDR